jgi:hypothetical protein
MLMVIGRIRQRPLHATRTAQAIIRQFLFESENLDIDTGFKPSIGVRHATVTGLLIRSSRFHALAQVAFQDCAVYEISR